MNAAGEPGVITALHDLLKWYMETTLRFPKSYRVTLGDRIDEHLLDMLETAVRARYARDKRKLLHDLNMQVEILRHLTRVAVGLSILQPKQYEFVARCTEDVGRQVGGWLRSERRRDGDPPTPAATGPSC